MRSKNNKKYLISIVQNNLEFDTDTGRFYVYGLFYYDDNGEEVCFYIGKGTDDRHKFHFRESNLNPERSYNSDKIERILELKDKNKEPYSDFLFKSLSEENALKIEKYLLSRDEIYSEVTNVLRGGFPLSGKKHPMYGKKHTLETLEKISKLNREDVKEIKWLIENSVLTNKQIANEFDINRCTVSSIKLRNTNSHIYQKLKPEWYTKEFEKNVLDKRREEKSSFSVEEVKEIRWICENTELTLKEISDRYHISGGQISSIGSYKKLSHITDTKRPEWITDEIISSAAQKKENYMKGEKNPSMVLSDDEVKEVNWLMKNSKLNLNIIADEYGVCKTTVSAIKNKRARSYIQTNKKPDWYSKECENEKIRKRKKDQVKNNSLTKLSDREVKEIKWLLDDSNLYQKEIAERYDISIAQVSNIKNGRSRSYVQEKIKPSCAKNERCVEVGCG